MKDKKVITKLAINKQTIANLRQDNMKNVKAGITTQRTDWTYTEVCIEYDDVPCACI